MDYSAPGAKNVLPPVSAPAQGPSDGDWFYPFAGLLAVVSWAYSGLVWLFAGSCDTPARGWELDGVRGTQRHLMILLIVMASLWLAGVVGWRGRRYEFVLAGLFWCAPLAMLLMAHHDPYTWHSNFCVGGP